MPQVQNEVKGGLIIREATAADVLTIATHRRRMFESMGYDDDALLDSIQLSAAEWTRKKAADGEYRGWLVSARDGRIVASVGIWLREICSKPRNLSGRIVYLMNVYTEPAYRRRGWARRLVQTALDWCGRNGYDEVTLHASHAGRQLYESLGFRATSEMRFRPEHVGEERSCQS
jgi:GNAT superfamily N-acetyltransferase